MHYTVCVTQTFIFVLCLPIESQREKHIFDFLEKFHSLQKVLIIHKHIMYVSKEMSFMCVTEGWGSALSVSSFLMYLRVLTTNCGNVRTLTNKKYIVVYTKF